jgi:hypothetical protein
LDQATDPVSYVAAFDAWTEANIGAWYEPQAQADASLARRMQAAVDGQPSPPPAPMERLRLAIFAASRTAVRTALDALLTARPELTARAAGPRREEIAVAGA